MQGLFSRGLPLVLVQNCLNCHRIVKFLGVFLCAAQREIVLIVLIVIVFSTQEMNVYIYRRMTATSRTHATRHSPSRKNRDNFDNFDKRVDSIGFFEFWAKIPE